MFKKIFYGSLVIIALAYVFRHKISSPASHDGIRETVSDDFHSINIKGNFTVELEHSNSSRFEIQTQENNNKHLEIYIDDQTLYVKNKKSSWLDKDSKTIHLTIGAPELRYIEAHGAVELIGKDPINTQELEIEVSGASEGRLDIDTKYLYVRTNGAADFNISGRSESADMQVSGAGEIKAFDLDLDKLDIQISGAGHAEVMVEDYLNIQVSGAGSVKYKGSPAEISQQVSGAGSVRKVN